MARPRAQDYEQKRRGILHKAAELFAKFGYSASSITMIAEACGVSKALLYHYYSDKEAVLYDLLQAHLAELVEVADGVAAEDLRGRERLVRLVEALLEAYRDADAEHQVQIANLKHLSEERQATLLSMERRLVKIFSDAIADALPTIAREPLLKPLTMSLFGMLNWHYLWFREGKGLTRKQYGRLVAELILSGAPGVMNSLQSPSVVKLPQSPRRAKVR